MEVIRRAALPQAAAALRQALSHPHSGPLTMAFALRLDRDPLWTNLGPESRRKIVESVEAPLVSSATSGDIPSLLALHALGKPPAADIAHVSRDLGLRLFCQAAGMHTCQGVARQLAERLVTFEDWQQGELAQFLLGVIELGPTNLSREFMEKCAAHVPESPLLPELGAACWKLRQTHSFPFATALSKEVTLQSVAALAFLSQVQGELDTDITAECLRLPDAQLAAFCEDRAIWNIVRPEAIAERLATVEMATAQRVAICTTVAAPSGAHPTVAYDLLVEGLVGEEARPIAPLTRNLARLPLESETVDNVLPYLLRAAQSQLSPHALVAFDEFHAAHGGDVSPLFAQADPDAFTTDEVCLALSAATKLVRRQTNQGALSAAPPWAQEFFARHCARLLAMHDVASLKECRAYQLDIIAGAFRVLRSPRMSEAEGRLVELLAQDGRSSLVRGILEEIGRKDPGVDSRLPKDRIRDFMKSETQTFQAKKTFWQRMWG